VVHEDGRATTVVFDLGNVFIRWDRALLYRSVFDDPDELEHFLNHVYTLEVNDRLDRGQPLDEFCRQLAREHPRFEPHISLLRDRWIETIGDVLEDTVEVLDELLAAGVPCYALSNWNGDTFRLVAARHEFFGRFDGIVLSGHEGVVKPDPEIFRRLLDRYAIAPEAALFVDDSQKNVDAARKVGMQAELFTDAGALRASLVRRGLLTRTSQ
jgi:HAD superfamily hydrolase (TIGR01509 family)